MVDEAKSNDGFAYQLNVKLPVGADPRGYRDDLLNIRANSAEEFKEKLDAFLEEPGDSLIHSMIAVEAMVKASAVVAVGLAATEVANSPEGAEVGGMESPQADDGDPVPQAYREAFEGKSRKCKHGQRQFIKGNGWAGLMCSLPKEQKSEQCSPEWADKRKLAKG